MDAIVANFLAAEELGEITLIRYGRVPADAPASEPTWSFLPHVRFDGISGFRREVAEHEGGAEVPMHGRSGPPPGPLGRLRALLGAVDRARRSPTRAHIKWSHFDRNAVPGIPTALGHVLLDEGETKRLLRSAEASPNSRLLWALDQVVSGLAAPIANHLWAVPVDLRAALGQKDTPGNIVSTVPVEFPLGATKEAVHAAIRERLKAGAQWGTRDFMALGALRGTEGVRRSLRAYHERPGHAWLGTFSNLGDRTAPGHAARFFYFFAPPVTVVHPVGAGCVAWGGRMSLTLQLHAALGSDRGLAQRLAESWKALALEASG